jgi:hypothetical protein
MACRDVLGLPIAEFIERGRLDRGRAQIDPCESNEATDQLYDFRAHLIAARVGDIHQKVRAMVLIVRVEK